MRFLLSFNFLRLYGHKSETWTTVATFSLFTDQYRYQNESCPGILSGLEADMNSIKPRIHDKLLLPVMRDVFLAFYKRASITGIGDKKAGTTINRATSRHVQAREGYDSHVPLSLVRTLILEPFLDQRRTQLPS